MAGQYKFKDTNGNVVSSISGSNTGVISFSGSLVDFSNTIISGTASNALLLDGFDSTAFVFTSSFNTISQSISSDLLNLKSKSSSVDISISNINQFTASNGNTSLNSYTASNDTKFTTLGSYTGSNDTKWTSISNVTSSLIQVTGSYATTGSNTFKGTQIVSASMYVQGDLVVYGSSSIQYISASSVSIGTNIVQLNTNQPAVRFGGLSVQDSGSAVGVTGSMFWDGCCNRWIYSNPSGVGYSGGVLMSGPRGSTLGNEPTLTCNYIAKSGGGDHLYDSCVYELSGSVGINTNTPSGKLHVVDNSGSFFFDGSLPTYNRFKSTTTSPAIGRNLQFSTQDIGTTPDLFISSSGNVGIGTCYPSNVLDIAKASQDSMVILTESSDNGDCTALFYARRSRGTSLTSPTTIQSANNLGGLAIGGHDGSSYKMGAKIFGLAAENWSVGCNGTDIIFSTNSTAKCLPTEKVRINASGLVNFACNICVNNNVIIYNGSNSFYAWTNCSSFQPGLYGQICIGSSMTGIYTKMYGSGVDAGLFGINTQCMAFVGTDGACGKGLLIGTANNAPIYVGTNNIEAFRVTTNQYLLLGSTQNSYKLEVTAPTNTNASYFRAGGTSGYAAIAFSGDGGQAIGVLSTVSNDIIYLGTANGTIGNQFGTNGEFAIQKGSNTNMSIY